MKVWIGQAGVPSTCEKRDTLSGVRCTKEKGLNAMEVQFVRGVKMSEDKAKEIGELAKRLGMYLSIHAPYYINLNAKDKEKLEKSIKDWLYKSCEIGRHFARIVVFHPASYMGLPKEATYARVRENLGKVVKLLEENNINIILGPETTGKKAQFGDLDELIRLGKEFENVKPVVDFAHLHARGFRIKSKQDFLKILEKLEKNFEPPYHFHFSCINYTEKGERNHLPLSAKEPNYEYFIEALKEIDLGEIALISETPDPIEGALQMKEMLKELDNIVFP